MSWRPRPREASAAGARRGGPEREQGRAAGVWEERAAQGGHAARPAPSAG